VGLWNNNEADEEINRAYMSNVTENFENFASLKHYLRLYSWASSSDTYTLARMCSLAFRPSFMPTCHYPISDGMAY
jgi:hypothetical protein